MMTDATQRATASRPTILFWVQHLLGIGHLARVSALADACAALGMDAHVASGGPPAGHATPTTATLHQLPALRAADEQFGGLLDGAGEAAAEQVWRARQVMLRKLVDRLDPAIIVLEHYPFGRRAFRTEIAELLHAVQSHKGRARGRCQTVVSVRDILVGRQAKRWAEAADFIDSQVDLVCVHGDPALVEFGATFPLAGQIAPKIRYTGYVDLGSRTTPEAKVADGASGSRNRGEILVSSGSGPVGARLRDVALEMATGPNGETLRIRVGHTVGKKETERLKAQAARSVIVEPNQPDFRSRLKACACSVSQAGYNTVVDLLSTGTPAVLVPFETGGETEQAFRASRLAALNRAVTVRERRLTVDGLRQAIGRAMAQRPAETRINPSGISLSGAPHFAEIMQTMAADR